jgi:hypothetical protein
MPEARDYRAMERLRDGRQIEIRALRPDDKDDMLAAIGRISTESLQRRFFVVKRGFSQKEIDFFMKIDFDSHVALVKPKWPSWSSTAIKGKASEGI